MAEQAGLPWGDSGGGGPHRAWTGTQGTVHQPLHWPARAPTMDPAARGLTRWVFMALEAEARDQGAGKSGSWGGPFLMCRCHLLVLCSQGGDRGNELPGVLTGALILPRGPQLRDLVWP